MKNTFGKILNWIEINISHLIIFSYHGREEGGEWCDLEWSESILGHQFIGSFWKTQRSANNEFALTSYSTSKHISITNWIFLTILSATVELVQNRCKNYPIFFISHLWFRFHHGFLFEKKKIKIILEIYNQYVSTT